MMGISGGEIILMTGLTILTQYRHLMDGQPNSEISMPVLCS